MQSSETQTKLKDLLNVVARGELSIEAARQRICSIRDFAPISTFQRIDRHRTGRITSFDIIEFIKDRNNYCYCENDCHKIVNYFS